jgi:hypothetical protein
MQGARKEHMALSSEKGLQEMVKKLKVSPEKAKEILETLEDELSPHDWQLIKEIFEDSIRLGIVTIVQNDRDVPPES